MKKLIMMYALFGIFFTACDKADTEGDCGGSEIAKIGDLVEIKGRKGVVFYVDDNITKIVSVEESSLQLKWSTECVSTGATDYVNGANNMALIQLMPGWETKYPVFAWSADYGQGWYIPALNELQEIYDQISAINTTLSANGYALLEQKWYWSSTEYDNSYACDYDFSNGYYSGNYKSSLNRVRCVFAF